VGLFKKKKQAMPELPADLPPMPDMPSLDAPTMPNIPTQPGMPELPPLPDLDSQTTSPDMPTVPMPDGMESTMQGIPIPEPMDDFEPMETPAPVTNTTDSLDNFHISDEDLAGLELDEPEPMVPTQGHVAVPQGMSIEPERMPVEEPAPEIPEPPEFDDNEGPLFVTTRNFRTVIGMLDDSKREVESEVEAGSELLNNNGLQTKSLEHLHTELMQIYKKLNTVDEILFERN
jgi:hypothetical protein